MSRIVAKNLSVDFPVIGASRSFRSEVLAGKVGGLLRRSGTGAEPTGGIVKVQALEDLTFWLEEGDRLGLIGHNGAGKSTLLRVLAGSYKPTRGTLEVDGSVVPLLSLGVGMDNDFNGYDNILFYGLYMGLTRKEIAERSRDIAEFTELGDFLNLPTRTYSAGMLLRLSFAIATSIAPDILLIDEVFGAGDASFYDKAKKRMEKMLEASSLLVIATHSMAIIADYCTKGAVMDKGRLAFLGSTADAIKYYNDHINR
jgi:ABC-2 type transport system ATP-binding protein